MSSAAFCSVQYSSLFLLSSSIAPATDHLVADENFWLYEPSLFFLILLGWSDSIGAWIHNLAFGPGGSPAKNIIVVIAIFAIAYQVFNLFIASVFYYLFADVVPTQFLGRFMALFRVAGTCAGFVFNLLVLPHADTHLPWIFTIVALVYLVSFLLMCFHVREGEYPPRQTCQSDRTFLHRQRQGVYEGYPHYQQ